MVNTSTFFNFSADSREIINCHGSPWESFPTDPRESTSKLLIQCSIQILIAERMSANLAVHATLSTTFFSEHTNVALKVIGIEACKEAKQKEKKDFRLLDG